MLHTWVTLSSWIPQTLTKDSTMTDPSTASAGAPDTMSVAASDFEKIMPALNIFVSTMDTHGQALVLQQQTFARQTQVGSLIPLILRLHLNR